MTIFVWYFEHIVAILFCYLYTYGPPSVEGSWVRGSDSARSQGLDLFSVLPYALTIR